MMPIILKYFLVAFLVVNAIFWGLFPHHIHCMLVASFGLKKCPGHWIHITLGFVFFALAVLVAQRT